MATRKTSKKEMPVGSKKISRSGAAGPNMVKLFISTWFLLGKCMKYDRDGSKPFIHKPK